MYERKNGKGLIHLGVTEKRVEYPMKTALKHLFLFSKGWKFHPLHSFSIAVSLRLMISILNKSSPKRRFALRIQCICACSGLWKIVMTEFLVNQPLQLFAHRKAGEISAGALIIHALEPVRTIFLYLRARERAKYFMFIF